MEESSESDYLYSIKEITGFGADDDSLIVYSSVPLDKDKCEEIRKHLDCHVKFFTRNVKK